MSDYANRMFSSDLDAYRSDGEEQSRSIIFDGTVGAGDEKSVQAVPLAYDDQDFHQISFDNSVYSSGKFRDVSLESGTMVHETTRDSDLVVEFEVKLNGDNLVISGKLFNLYDETITLQSTTINFKIVAYDSTLL